MEGFDDFNPKSWAHGRARRKYSSRRECRKSDPNGRSLKRASKTSKRNEAVKQNTSSLDPPNPVEEYLQKFGYNPCDVQSHLSDIINETKPTEVVVVPSGKADRVSWEDESQDKVYLIYEKTEEQKAKDQCYRAKKTKELAKHRAEIPAHINIDQYLAKVDKTYVPLTRRKRAYEQPVVDEKAIGGVHASGPTFARRTSSHSHVTDDPSGHEYFFEDFGKNKWLTAVSTTYNWGYPNTYGVSEPKELRLLSGIGRYKVLVAVDEKEIEMNLEKLHLSSGRSPGTQEEEKETGAKAKKRGGKPAKKMRKKKSAAGSEPWKLKWSFLGTYSGDLTGFYLDLAKPFSLEKVHRINYTIKPRNPFCVKDVMRNGIMARYVKIIPMDTSCRNCQFSAKFYGFEVDLANKPIPKYPKLTNDFQLDQSKKAKEKDEKKSAKQAVTPPLAPEKQKGLYVTVEGIDMPIRVSCESLVKNRVEDDADMTSVGLMAEGKTYEFVKSFEHPLESWDPWYGNEQARGLKRQDSRYLRCLKKIGYCDDFTINFNR